MGSHLCSGRTSVHSTITTVVVTSIILLSSQKLLDVFSLFAIQDASPAALPVPSTSAALLDIGKICPSSLDINTENAHSPPAKPMQLDEIRRIVKYWHGFNCPRRKSCRFASVGQHLLHLAAHRNETLLSVQVGAMDGKSNDPLYEMFIDQRAKFLLGMEEAFSIGHWLPVLIEPVPQNYENMMKTYAKVARDQGLGCAVPIHAAVSYDGSKTECAFCRVNTAEDAPQRCREKPDWMRLQLGTLDCAHSRMFFNEDFDLCVLQDPLPCSSVGGLLRRKNVKLENIAMLQIDIEGYEYVLIEGFMKEVTDASLPPIIHFEHKVMRKLDMKAHSNITSRLDGVMDLLTGRGYVLYDEGEDYLAVRLSDTRHIERLR